MTAYFFFRGVEYRVSGWMWSGDGAANSMIVAREDGARIRGARMCPGMIQIGLSRSLERAAEAALEAARVAALVAS